MRVGLKLLPGRRGTRKLLAEYGDRLVCVRYRYDATRGLRFKTVELIVDQVPWRHRPRAPHPDQIVAVRTLWGEVDLGRRLRRAGGTWRRDRQVWELPYARVVALGLEERIVEPSWVNRRHRPAMTAASSPDSKDREHDPPRR